MVSLGTLNISWAPYLQQFFKFTFKKPNTGSLFSSYKRIHDVKVKKYLATLSHSPEEISDKFLI